MAEDPQVERLRELVEKATTFQQHATQLVVELTNQLQRSIWLHNDIAGQHSNRRQRKSPLSLSDEYS